MRMVKWIIEPTYNQRKMVEASAAPEGEKTIQTRIEEKVRAGLDVSDFLLQDKSGGCGQSFLLIVISQAFKDVKLLDRQRQVNEILSQEIQELHALELKTWTPEQWESKKSQYVS